MNRLLFVMLVVLIGLLVADFVNKLMMLNMLSVGTLAITHAFQRPNHMADINYYSRKIWAIAK